MDRRRVRVQDLLRRELTRARIAAAMSRPTRPTRSTVPPSAAMLCATLAAPMQFSSRSNWTMGTGASGRSADPANQELIEHHVPTTRTRAEENRLAMPPARARSGARASAWVTADRSGRPRRGRDHHEEEHQNPGRRSCTEEPRGERTSRQWPQPAGRRKPVAARPASSRGPCPRRRGQGQMARRRKAALRGVRIGAL